MNNCNNQGISVFSDTSPPLKSFSHATKRDSEKDDKEKRLAEISDLSYAFTLQLQELHNLESLHRNNVDARKACSVFLEELGNLQTYIEGAKVAVAESDTSQDHLLAKRMQRMYLDKANQERDEFVTLRRSQGLTETIPEINFPLSDSEEDENDQTEEKTASEKVWNEGMCNVCLEEHKPTIEFPCGHNHCKGCFRELLLVGMKEDRTLLPVMCCQKQVDTDLYSLVLKKDEMKQMNGILEQIIYADNSMYCPVPSCSHFINFSKIPPSSTIFSFSTVISCPGCGTQLCRTCKTLFHPGLSCQQATEIRKQEENNDNLLKDLASEKKWQTCPGCNAVVSLSQGCHHMQCRCKYEFCYVCAAKWKTCDCPHWQEERLVATAQEREPNNIVRQQNLVQRLRAGGECAAHQWHVEQRITPQTCSNCPFWMNMYAYRCSECRRRVCHVCRFHRIVL